MTAVLIEHVEDPLLGANIPDMFHTYFWSPNGTALQWKDIQTFQNFFVVPFVEMEDVFVVGPIAPATKQRRPG